MEGIGLQKMRNTSTRDKLKFEDPAVPYAAEKSGICEIIQLNLVAWEPWCNSVEDLGSIPSQHPNVFSCKGGRKKNISHK